MVANMAQLCAASHSNLPVTGVWLAIWQDSRQELQLHMCSCTSDSDSMPTAGMCASRPPPGCTASLRSPSPLTSDLLGSSLQRSGQL